MAPRHLVLSAIVGVAACGPRATPSPPEPVAPAPAEPPAADEPAPPAALAAPPAEPAPPEAEAPAPPAEPANPWELPADESEEAREARLDLRDRLGERCTTYLTTADVKKICRRAIRIVAPSEAGEAPDEWPPACTRTARFASELYPLRLVVDNELSDPRAAIALLAKEEAGARSVELGDAAIVGTEASADQVSHVVRVAVGPMIVTLEAAGRDAKAVPCTEAQLIELGRRVVARLPR